MNYSRTNLPEGYSIGLLENRRERGWSDEQIKRDSERQLRNNTKAQAEPGPGYIVGGSGMDVIDVAWGIMWVLIMVGWCLAWAS